MTPRTRSRLDAFVAAMGADEWPPHDLAELAARYGGPELIALAEKRGMIVRQHGRWSRAPYLQVDDPAHRVVAKP